MISPKVSIIIDNYNYERFVATAVESALNQTYPHCEVIVVDDGSTDGSREILAAYQSRVKLVLKQNGGQPSAFNAGFEAASGELVAFLDSDDALFPDAVKTAVLAWRKGIVKVQFPLAVLDQNGRATGLLMPRNPLAEGSLLEEYLKTGKYVAAPTSGNMFSRQFLMDILPMPEQEWETADGYINTCAPFFGEVAAIKRPLGFYRIHGNSMTTISHQGSTDLEKIKKLLRHATLEKSLFERLAQERALSVINTGGLAHWMDLKLIIAFHKLTEAAWIQRAKVLFTSGVSMIVSVAKASELSRFRKMQNICWTLGVMALPRANARWLIHYAFDKSPASWFSRVLRRA
jgi:glycosyltransferase involved in cell wall biosynthesis